MLDETFASAAAAGLHPAAVQLDFDCPVTQLRGYAAGLAALRVAYPGEAFQPTARASWLRSPDFAPLARAAGGYVLEVHGLVRSGNKDGKVSETLCDPGAAQDAVETAGALGVPFRVALPASGYRLILDASGRLVSATSDTRALPPARLPADGSERTLRPNAEDMAGLVTQWNWRRPAALRGILWDRLPVEGERLDWPAATFHAVRAGRVPKSRLEWKFPEPAEGSDGRELALHNTGDAEAPLPPLLTIRCPELPIAVEAAGPYEVVPRTPKEHLAPREVRFRLMKPVAADQPGDAAAAATSGTPPPPRTLAPGASLRFGSVRLPSANNAPTPSPEEMELDLEMKSPAATPSPGGAARR